MVLPTGLTSSGVSFITPTFTLISCGAFTLIWRSSTRASEALLPAPAQERAVQCFIKCAVCCEVFPKESTHRHHPDRADRKRVVLVCANCHAALHARERKVWTSKGGQVTSSNPENVVRNLRQFRTNPSRAYAYLVARGVEVRRARRIKRELEKLERERKDGR